jgi:hypothetical protein
MVKTEFQTWSVDTLDDLKFVDRKMADDKLIQTYR